MQNTLKPIAFVMLGHEEVVVMSIMPRFETQNPLPKEAKPLNDQRNGRCNM